jgi:hypothetical protein
VPHYYVTIGPEDRERHPDAPTPTWIVDAADEDAASDHAEATYRRDHAEVAKLRVRVSLSVPGR